MTLSAFILSLLILCISIVSSYADGWTRISLPEQYQYSRIQSIAVRSPDSIMVMAFLPEDSASCILLTSDAGVSWTCTNTCWCGGYLNWARQVRHVSEDNYVYYHPIGGCMYTTNSGNEWIHSDGPDDDCIHEGVHNPASYSLTKYGQLWRIVDCEVRGGGSIQLSTDYGRSWEEVNQVSYIPDEIPNESLISMLDEQRGLAAVSVAGIGNTGFKSYGILSTTNGWKDYQVVDTIQFGNIYQLLIVNDSNALLYVLGPPNTATKSYLTTSFGTDWRPINEYHLIEGDSLSRILQYECLQDSLCIGVGTNGIILQSLDAGASWYQLISPTQFKLNDVAIMNKQTVYIVGDSGTIYYTTTGGVSDVNEATTHDNPSPLSIYPNPADDAITVRGMEPGTAYHVVDILGQVVRTLLPDTSELKFSLMDLPPGVYTLVSPLHRIQFIRR